MLLFILSVIIAYISVIFKISIVILYFDLSLKCDMKIRHHMIGIKFNFEASQLQDSPSIDTRRVIVLGKCSWEIIRGES